MVALALLSKMLAQKCLRKLMLFLVFTTIIRANAEDSSMFAVENQERILLVNVREFGPFTVKSGGISESQGIDILLVEAIAEKLGYNTQYEENIADDPRMQRLDF